LENSLSLREFINLEELSIQNDGIQDYFSNPPRINRNKITSLDLLENKKLKELLCGNNRIGTLDLRNNKKIITIDCSGNELKNLDLSSCFYLEELNLRNNQLSSIDFLDSLPNSEKLNYLNISNNNFKAQDLSFLSKLTNLKKLFIGGNKFYGSLFFLKEINNLKELDISDTDIESGIEYLPENLEKIYCKIEKKGGGVGCFHIKNSLEKYCKEKDELYDFSS
jgi:Leucine-rich repeat (LRR) protein